MSEFFFGVGGGRISKAEIKRVEKIAGKHDSTFTVVTGNSGHCTCGYGCRIDRCPNKRWWFSTRNYGSPFDQQTAKAVMDEVGQIKTKAK